MILNFKTKKEQSSASAIVVDGKLILTFPDAISPVVWQMDLADAKASALEIEEDPANNHHKLVIKTAKGERVDVAKFSNRTEALAGLMAAAGALENAQGQIRAAASSGSAANDRPAKSKKVKRPPTPTQKKQTRNRWLTGILALVILFILLTIWSWVMPVSLKTNLAEEQASAVTGPVTESAGVPVSADDFFKDQ